MFYFSSSHTYYKIFLFSCSTSSSLSTIKRVGKAEEIKYLSTNSLFERGITVGNVRSMSHF